jgi:hypothetical protein
MGLGVFRLGILGVPLGEPAADCQRVSRRTASEFYSLLTGWRDSGPMVITALRSLAGSIVPLGIALAMQMAH